MKKNELIEKLQEIQGNPEVVIYNGATGIVILLVKSMKKLCM